MPTTPLVHAPRIDVRTINRTRVQNKVCFRHVRAGAEREMLTMRSPGIRLRRIAYRLRAECVSRRRCRRSNARFSPDGALG